MILRNDVENPQFTIGVIDGEDWRDGYDRILFCERKNKQTNKKTNKQKTREQEERKKAKSHEK